MTAIALDAMGGDFAPRAPVEAAVRAARESGRTIVLVGDAAAVEPELRRHGSGVSRVRVHHAAQQVTMDEPPAEALRRKEGASIRQAFELLRRGEVQAVVGAGPTGAIMVAGKMVLKTLPGIDRPAIAAHLPHKRGITVLLDGGANVDCKPHYLLQFARMGAIYAQAVLGREGPEVALLSNGSEAGKGNELTRLAHGLLESSGLAYVGNLEPRDLFRGRADVVVCDGFVGNLVLKTAEAAGSHSRLLLRESVARAPLAKLGYWLLRGFFVDLARRTDYREIGGSPLLGLGGVAIVCHGSSSARAIKNGLALAARCAESRLVEALRRGLAPCETRRPVSD